MDLKGRGEQSTMKRYLAYVLLITIIFISSCGSSNSSATKSEEDVISIDETVSEVVMYDNNFPLRSEALSAFPVL